MDTFPQPAAPPPPPSQSLLTGTAATGIAAPIITGHSAPIPFTAPGFTVNSTVNTIPFSGYAEAQSTLNHSVANPSPNPGVVPGHGLSAVPSHPPYAEMIFAAIGALKEKNGSSKKAIAKYIEQAYTGLPPTHPSLLANHLKRLKNSGLLAMIKKSYILPTDSSVAAATAAATASPLPSPGSHRGRGRPPKAKPDPNALPAVQPNTQPITQPAVQFNGHTDQPAAQSSSQPVLVALGLVDDPNPSSVKKRPGRPKKGISAGVVAQGSPVGQGTPGSLKRGRGRPPGSKGKMSGPRLSKKSPGRPPKPKSVSAVQGPKRGPGRPSKAEPKTMIIPYASNEPIVNEVDHNNTPTVLSVPPRSRGRPKRFADAAGSPASFRSLSGRRRGRPSKVAGISKLNNSSGRPVGRPKKSTIVATELLVAANADLKRKFEFVQTKIKQTVGMLKPNLSHESPATLIAAVQELEELAVLDVNAPLREEVQQPL
ncbi:histone H1 isoform X1 [Cannabis sativa]|uniref:histone H1 isoform X1 n=1 Tax=Cannabis sativa TaxID=3483 RepID=UPI0029CAA35E|nr:histone H1 isoform X1 [Cannabis sativa]XP_030488339.2 histone H1 isoform X1 [Cannabis sativa]